MKNKIITIGVIAVVVALLALPKLTALKKESRSGGGTPGGGAGAAGGTLAVEAMLIRTEKLDNKLVLTGSVLPNESLELRSEISGKVEGITFKEGSAVKKGDLLVQIEDDEIKAQLEKQKYNRKLNEDNEFRQRKLLEKEAISQEEYDNALNRLNTTNADIKLLQVQYDKTRIRAPFEGVIGLRYVSEGSFINTNTIIATLYSISPAKIEFAVPGRYSLQVQPGKKIFFSIENDSTMFEGEVYAVEPRIDPATRTLKLRALADNSRGLLLPGQFVKVNLILATIEQAILVPTESVIPEQNGKKVFVLDGGKAKEVKIETGLRTDRYLEVVSGLQVGDTLLTTGILQLRPGMDVQISKLRSPTP
jgi:membrane fusion protein (multidrug efflux system)